MEYFLVGIKNNNYKLFIINRKSFTMKKRNCIQFFYSLLIFLLISCSSSSESNDNASINLFNPPNWIQGVWRDNTSSGFKFTNDNVCELTAVSQHCYKEMVNNSNMAIPNSATVNESVISDNEYKFSYTVQGQTVFYHFIKVSNTKIELVNQLIPGMPNPVYIKQ